jgi:hypothetical protein
MKSKRKRARDQYSFGDDPICQDGESISVPVFMLDGFRADLVRHFAADASLAGHRPGWAGPLSADQIEARRSMIARAVSDWKMDKRRKPPPDDDDDENGERSDFGASMGDISSIRRPAIEARDAYVAALGSNWRTGPAVASPAPERLPRANATRLRDDAQPDLGARPEELQRSVTRFTRPTRRRFRTHGAVLSAVARRMLPARLSVRPRVRDGGMGHDDAWRSG